ncbi:glutamyl-tRNA amidotransferase [Phaeosphaeriaceae sp. PMI808]|nr:glutamyl-tRNA amidotransferase [Phaeosphaeriaceae sp. PMI808]
MEVKMRLQALSVAFVAFTSGVQAAVSSTGFTVSLNDIDYFLPPKPVASVGCEGIQNLFKDGLFVPMTVVASNNTLNIATYRQDDVWQDAFLEVVYFRDGSAPMNSSYTTLSSPASDTLNPGPYFVNSVGQVYEAWRLFSDVQGAFTESCTANGDGSYAVLPASTVGQKLAIAVPSRMYFTKTAEKPLAGIRIGIKDIYDIKGLRTSNGNRAWYWLYPPARNTAPPVQNLIEAGAIIVGKMITSQFANGETPTADWVDYHDSFNPRGDGYQDTSSSSAGGGTGAASYSWLDVALGSDTGGSVRGPSQVQGVYGNRPSHGLVSLEHTMSLSPTLDTPGLLARDPIIWMQAAQAMYRSNVTISSTYPKNIRTLSWPTSATSQANRLLINFLGNLTNFLQANVSAYNFTAAFGEDNPTRAPLTTILNTTYALIITKQQTKLVRDPFYADYAAKHDGRRPFVNPVPLARWGWGDNQTTPLEEAIANKTIFMDWANSKFLVPSKSTCSESLVAYVGSTAQASPRNIYVKEPGVPFGLSDSRISVMAEVPDFVVPIGEAPYNSTITGHVEYLPVSVNLMVAKGCDGMLFSLIARLHAAGILKTALAGRSGVTGGEILLRRELMEY